MAESPGSRSIVLTREKWSPTSPRRRSELNRWPSKVTMPAASWPRCCRAGRPRAGIRAAMLEGGQAEGGDLGGVGVVVDAEDAALLAQPISVDIEAFDIGSATHAVR